jgi:DNA-binding LacI/PurR family transcriptional regulator
MPSTIKDVAKKAGVGIGTVSRVFNSSPLVSQETQQKVLQAARELDYYPDASARRLVQGKTRIIAFVERHSPRQSYVDAFMAEVLRGIHFVCLEENYHVLIEPQTSPNSGDLRLLHLVREKHADGMIISGPRFNDELIISLKQENIPVVLQGFLPGSDLPSVDVDNLGGAKTAVDHLIRLGHKRIGLITNGPLIYSAALARQQGYEAALRESNLPLDPDLLREGEFNPESGARAMKSLLALSNPPTAVFIASDMVAIGVIQAIRKARLKIPQDIALVGLDDIPWAAYLSPGLTTIRLPAQEIGQQAAKLLITFLEGNTPSKTKIFLPTKLIIRDSCGAKQINN